MLVEAAAEKWKISANQCVAKDSRVIHPDGRSLSYGNLAEAAAQQPVPPDPVLKKPEDYRIIGTQRKRLDIPDKVMGKTVYGIDFSMPGMCIALVARPPYYGGNPFIS